MNAILDADPDSAAEAEGELGLLEPVLLDQGLVVDGERRRCEPAHSRCREVNRQRVGGHVKVHASDRQRDHSDAWGINGEHIGADHV